MTCREYDVSKRGPSYGAFIDCSDPTFAMTVRIDVTDMFKWCKRNRRSFFIEFLYAVSRTANGIEGFRVRLVDGRPMVYDRVDPSYIVIKDDQSICTCRSEFTEDREAFFRDVRKTIDSNKSSADKGVFNGTRELDVLYISCVPWVDAVSFKNPYDLKDRDACSIPRITWAKVTAEGERYRVTVDVAAHHALMDGYHLSQFFNGLQRAADDFQEE